MNVRCCHCQDQRWAAHTERASHTECTVKAKKSIPSDSYTSMLSGRRRLLVNVRTSEHSLSSHPRTATESVLSVGSKFIEPKERCKSEEAVWPVQKRHPPEASSALEAPLLDANSSYTMCSTHTGHRVCTIILCRDHIECCG